MDAAFHTRGRLNVLRPVLAEWAQMKKRFCLGVGEPPYWHIERSAVGLLATAVWRADGFAVEEYNARRSRGPRTTQGHCDLRVRMNDSTVFMMEAKHQWIAWKPSQRRWSPLKSHKGMGDAITDRLREAEDVLRITDAASGVVRVALVFVPCFLRPSDATEAADHLREFVDLLDIEHRDIGAWVLPDGNFNRIGFENNYYPGTALVGCTVE